MARVQLTSVFSGQVQSVGFRATVWALTRKLRVTGYVRNEPDGTVLMKALGEDAELDRLLKAIQDSRLGPLIRKASHQRGPMVEEFDRFEIRY